MDDLMAKIQEVLSDEESLKQLNELASSLFSSSENEADTNNDDISAKDQRSSDSSADFDVRKLLMIGQVMNSVSNDKNTDLLLALRPLLKEDRRERVDRAVKMLKLFAVWSVLKESGILDDLI